jgi:hypothetical protein
MRDTGHTKLSFETEEDAEEYEDFFDQKRAKGGSRKSRAKQMQGEEGKEGEEGEEANRPLPELVGRLARLLALRIRLPLRHMQKTVLPLHTVAALRPQRPPWRHLWWQARQPTRLSPLRSQGLASAT